VVKNLVVCNSSHAFTSQLMEIFDHDEHSNKALRKVLDEILAEVKNLKWMVQKMSQATANTLDSLTARVQAEETAEDSLVVMLNGLIAASGGDPVKMQALADELTKSDAKLAAMTAALAATLAPGTTGTTGATNVLTISPASVSLAVGGSTQLKVTDSNGLDVTKTAVFVSADQTVATALGGLVAAVKTGSTQIAVTNGTETGSVNVTVA
jgi:Bacterial Ig-like domain (group 2)